MKEMCCGVYKIWPLFCRVEPSATRMYNLVIVIGFLRGEHPECCWGRAAARDPGIAIISQFNLWEIGNEMEDCNVTAEYKEDYGQEERIAGETPIIYEK